MSAIIRDDALVEQRGPFTELREEFIDFDQIAILAANQLKAGQHSHHMYPEYGIELIAINSAENGKCIEICFLENGKGIEICQDLIKSGILCCNGRQNDSRN